MENSVLGYITNAFAGAVDIITDLINNVPAAKTAIIWAVFAVLGMSMLIIPIRGFGSAAITGARSDTVRKRNKENVDSNGD